MGWDFADDTVRILETGELDVPASPVPSLTFAAAMHRGERFGAVLFLRLWRNGKWDSDSALTARAPDGRWEAPGGCGGYGWVDPYVRPETWDGRHLCTMGGHGTIVEDVDGLQRELVAVDGIAGQHVRTILVESRDGSFEYELTSPLGAFIVVVEGATPPQLTPFDERGVPLSS